MSKRSVLTGMLAGLAAILLAGCEEPPSGPPVELPVLERPVARVARQPGDAGAVLVPRAALVMRGGIPGVFVLTRDNGTPPEPRVSRARFRMVKTGKTFGRRIQIISGLIGNETLVLGDLSEVHDGSPIRVIESQ